MGFQIGGAILDFVVLSVLQREDQYGYVLTQQVREILDVSETAMYPALKRLQKCDFLRSYDQPFQGRNRRYYTLSEAGKAQLGTYIAEWNTFKNDMDLLLTNEVQDGHQ